MITKLSSKGQIVVPRDIRRRLGLRAGASLSCEIDQSGRIVLDPTLGSARANLEREKGHSVLVAPKGAPEMNAEFVKDILSD